MLPSEAMRRRLAPSGASGEHTMTTIDRRLAPSAASVTPRRKRGETAAENPGAFSPESASRYLDISPRQMARLLADGSVPSFRVGRLRRVRKVALDAWLEAQEAATGGGGDAA